MRAALAVTRAMTGTVFTLAFSARLHGPCYRCLGDAVLEVPIRAREYQASTPDDEELRRLTSPRPARRLRVGPRRGRARAAGQDPLPAGLRRALRECGKNLNDEPHEHGRGQPTRAGRPSKALREQLLKLDRAVDASSRSEETAVVGDDDELPG